MRWHDQQRQRTTFWAGRQALILGLCLIGTLIPTDKLWAEAYSSAILIEDEDDINDLVQNELITEEEQLKLLSLYRDKINLNKASRDELYRLPGITYPIVDAILAERSKIGAFDDIKAIKNIPGIDDPLFNQFKPFMMVTVKKKRIAPIWQDISGKVQLKGITNLSDKTRVTKTKYFSGSGSTKKELDSPEVTIEDSSNEPNPSFYTQLDMSYLDRYDAGVLVLMADDLAAPTYVEKNEDIEYSSFYSDGMYYRINPAKYYTSGELGKFSYIAGHFKIGFGQGLTLDTTSQTNPYGFYKDNDVSESTESASYSSPEGFRGVAVSYKGLMLTPSLSLNSTAFISYNSISMYQYDFGPYLCEDGLCTLQSNTICEDEPCVYKSNGDVDTTKSQKISYATIPAAFNEMAGGFNARLYFSEHNYVGTTAYFANLAWNYGDDLTFSKSAKYPDDRSTFGAGGIEFGAGYEFLSLFGEATVMDSGAPAFLLKGIVEKKPVANETVFKYYATDYKNPHGRGIANGDEWQGRRASDELGVVNKIAYTPWRFLVLKWDVDLWERFRHYNVGNSDLSGYQFDDESSGQSAGDTGQLSDLMKIKKWNLDTSARVDYLHKYFRVGLFSQYVNKDLGADENTFILRDDEIVGQTYSAVDKSGYPAGQKISLGTQIMALPSKASSITFFYKRSYEDVKSFYESQDMPEDEAGTFAAKAIYNKMMPGHYFWVKGTYKVGQFLGLAARYKFLDENVLSDFGGDYYHEVYGEAELKLFKKIHGKVRYMYQTRQATQIWPADSSGEIFVITTQNDTKENVHQIKGTLDYSF